MRAGKLDRTITLQRATETVDAAGTVVKTWTDLATMRAELIAPAPPAATTAPTAFNDAKDDRAYGPADAAVLVFRTRYLAGLAIADRVLYAGAAYKITGLTEIGRRRGLVIRCEALK